MAGRVLKLLLIIAFAAGCGDNGTAPLDPVPADAPTFAELNSMLQSEFTRLGIDPDKVPAAVPTGNDNAVFDLQLTTIDPDGEGGDPPTAVELTWTERMIADYDQNGLITAGDLTPLGQHFRKTVTYDDPALHDGDDFWPTGDPEDGGSGTDNWRLARIDGNGDGLLEISDITPLALNWNARMSGYVIERAVNQGTGQWLFDADYLDIGHGTSPSVPRSVNYLPGEMAVDPNKPVRYSVTVPMADAGNAQLFRVRAYDDATDEAGWYSNSTTYLPTITTDTTPPVWVDTVGVTNLVPAPNQLTVEFGIAEDDQSPPVTYRVYWAESDPEQPEAPFEYTTASFTDASTAPHAISGLIDGQYYRVAVRAMDSADTPNIELNEVVMGREAGAADIYPPEWQGRVGIQDVYFGAGVALLIWDPAVDDHTDEFGTWKNGPVTYRVYHGPGTEPDWENAEIEEFVDLGQEHYVVPLEGIDTSSSHWYAVRAFDSTTIKNEDDNEVFKAVPGILQEYYEFPPKSNMIPDDAFIIGPSTGGNVISNSSFSKTCIIRPWRDRHSDEKWIEVLDIQKPPATEWRLLNHTHAYYGIKDYFLDNDGFLSWIYSNFSGLEGERCGYYQGEDSTFHDYPTILGTVWQTGFLLDGSPFVFCDRLTFEDSIFLVAADQYYINLATGFEFNYNHREGDSYYIQNSMFVLGNPVVMSNNDIILSAHLHKSFDIFDRLQLTFKGNVIEGEADVHRFADEAYYYNSYGYDVNDTVDCHLPTEYRYPDLMHVCNDDTTYVFDPGESIHLGYPELMLRDIDNIAIRHSCGSEYLYESEEYSFIKMIDCVLDGQVIHLLPVGFTFECSTQDYGFTQDELILGITEEGTSNLIGYQLVSLAN